PHQPDARWPARRDVDASGGCWHRDGVRAAIFRHARRDSTGSADPVFGFRHRQCRGARESHRRVAACESRYAFAHLVQVAHHVPVLGQCRAAHDRTSQRQLPGASLAPAADWPPVGDAAHRTELNMTESLRTEKDPLGSLDVPAAALYGVQTVRATVNFPISGLRPLPMFVTGVVWIKKAAALTHRETGRLDPRLADAIIQAADEVLAGQHRENFVVDVYQAGAGTSHNMNVNEVLANRANEILGSARG